MEEAASRATARTDVLQHNTAQNQMALTEPYTFWLEAGVCTRACAQEDVRTSTAQNAGAHPMEAARLQTTSW